MAPNAALAWVFLHLAVGLADAKRGPDPLGECRALLAREPRSPSGYLCLFGAASAHPAEVRQLLDRRIRGRQDDPWALLYGGLFHSYAGENVPEAQYARAVQGFRRASDDTGLVSALASQLGQRCFAEDQCDDTALRLLEEAERVAEAGDDVHLRRLAQLWWFRWAVKEDDLARSDRALHRLEALPAVDPPWMSALLLAQRAFFAGVLRDLEEKLALYSEMVQQSSAGSPQRAAALGGQASAAASLALRGTFDRAEAEHLLRAAIAEQDRVGLQVSLADPAGGSLASRVQLALLVGRTDESLTLLDQVRAAYRSRPGWSYPWYADWLQARYLSEGPGAQPERALAAAEAGVERAASDHSGWEHARSLLMRAFVRWRTGARELARGDALAALDSFEALRRQQGDDRTRMRYEDTLAFAYELAAGSVLDAPRVGEAEIAEALATMERLRARGLLEALIRGGGGSEGGEPEGIIDRTHRRLLDPTVPGPERVRLVGELRQAERAHARARTEGRAAAALRGVPAVPELQQALRPGEALVSFQQWSSEPDVDAPYPPGTSWAIVLTRDARRAVRIPGAAALEGPARLWISLLERRDGSDAEGGAWLYQQLLAPVVASLPPSVDSLVVVPDGAIHRLPLEALRTSSPGAYVVERFQIAVVPSAAVWLRLRNAPPRSGGPALALADPVPSPAGRRELERVGLAGNPDLPLGREEAAHALDAFPRGSRLLQGTAATEEGFKRAAAEGYALFHVASHGLVDLLRPERSALVLGAGPTEDGLLTLEEITRLRVDRAVVVLGACHTSGGAVRRGEGMLSLGRAFFEGGARTVVANLAAVRDDESAALFAAFYRRIAAGDPVGTALVEAKRERLRAGAPPASWATTVLLGDAGSTPVPAAVSAWRRWVPTLVGVGLVLLAVGLWAGWRPQQRVRISSR